MEAPLSGRQLRELEYHKAHADAYRDAATNIKFDIIETSKRRWWNAYWEMYRYLRSLELRGKKVLVVGCGFGHDAIRIARMGADVYAFDISPDLLDIGRKVGRASNVSVDFQQMPAEELCYPDRFFDLVLMVDILHHCEFEPTLIEIRRVSKPGAIWIVDEIYTHSVLQRIRESRLVSKHLYPIITPIIYPGKPYITEDERKLNEAHLQVLQRFVRAPKTNYYYVFVKRLLPETPNILSKIDRTLLKSIGTLGRFLAGRFVLIGSVSQIEDPNGPASPLRSGSSVDPIETLPSAETTLQGVREGTFH
jgi:ubiquinone/menaquinone biosynthesis C-methylase UbiE